MLNAIKGVNSKVKSGILWTSIQQFGTIGVQFFSIVILSRLLTPRDYGLLGMISIFITISNMLVDSGMGGSLLYKKNINQIDYYTLFIYNLVISCCIYVVIFFIAPFIADFYETPELSSLMRILAISIVINSFSIVQRYILYRNLKYKKIAIINLLSGSISLVLAIILAYNKLGVWSLIFQQVSSSFLTLFFLVLTTKFIPQLKFSKVSFCEQFSFGMNLLGAHLLKSLSENLSSNIIAKNYSSYITGSYVQANRLQSFPVNMITNVLDKALFPIYAKFSDFEKMLLHYRSLSRVIYSFILPLLFLLLLFSKEFILVFLGNQWMDSFWMFKILIISSIPMIIKSLDRNVLKSAGKTKTIFVNEILSSIVTLIVLILTSILGIKYMLWGFVFSQTISCFLQMYSLAKELKYNLLLHIKDMLPFFIVPFISYIICLIFYYYFESSLLFLIILTMVYVLIIFLLFEVFKISEFKYVLFSLYKYISKK